MRYAGIQEIDVHGMNRQQAFTRIDAALRKADQSVYTLRIVHGYHSGTALRDGIRQRYRSHPKIKRVELSLNQGITDLILREL